MKFICATKNKHKMIEIEAIFNDTKFTVASMDEFNIDIDIVEDGLSYEENALIKARTIMNITSLPVLSDDSGIEVDFLNKEPGIYSARYLGVDTPQETKNGRILQLLKDVPKNQRTARFVCCVALVLPTGIELTALETNEGYITTTSCGENGFGYDPIFFVPEFSKTMAELTKEQKNKISHRAKALQNIKSQLLELNI